MVNAKTDRKYELETKSQRFTIDLYNRDFYIVKNKESLHIFSAESLLDRLTKIAANPFEDWSYPKAEDHQDTDVPVILLKDTSLNDTTSSLSQNKGLTEAAKPGLKRGRKRTNPTAPEPDLEIKKIAVDFKNNEKEKESKEKQSKEQIQLQEFYYATMEGHKNLISQECKSFIHFKVGFSEICHNPRQNGRRHFVIGHAISDGFWHSFPCGPISKFFLPISKEPQDFFVVRSDIYITTAYCGTFRCYTISDGFLAALSAKLFEVKPQNFL